MPAAKAAYAEPFDAQALDGEVVVLGHDVPVAMAMTPEAALKTAEVLRAAGLAALEQQPYRRKDPNTGRLPRPAAEA